eukprot:169440-Chlamydomonas_euryale.AAC.5
MASARWVGAAAAVRSKEACEGGECLGGLVRGLGGSNGGCMVAMLGKAACEDVRQAAGQKPDGGGVGGALHELCAWGGAGAACRNARQVARRKAACGGEFVPGRLKRVVWKWPWEIGMGGCVKMDALATACLHRQDCTECVHQVSCWHAWASRVYPHPTHIRNPRISTPCAHPHPARIYTPRIHSPHVSTPTHIHTVAGAPVPHACVPRVCAAEAEGRAVRRPAGGAGDGMRHRRELRAHGTGVGCGSVKHVCEGQKETWNDLRDVTWQLRTRTRLML